MSLRCGFQTRHPIFSLRRIGFTFEAVSLTIILVEINKAYQQVQWQNICRSSTRIDIRSYLIYLICIASFMTVSQSFGIWTIFDFLEIKEENNYCYNWLINCLFLKIEYSWKYPSTNLVIKTFRCSYLRSPSRVFFPLSLRLFTQIWKFCMTFSMSNFHFLTIICSIDSASFLFFWNEDTLFLA